MTGCGWFVRQACLRDACRGRKVKGSTGLSINPVTNFKPYVRSPVKRDLCYVVARGTGRTVRVLDGGAGWRLTQV